MKKRFNLELSFNDIALIRRALIGYISTENDLSLILDGIAKDYVLEDIKTMENLVSQLILLETEGC